MIVEFKLNDQIWLIIRNKITIISSDKYVYKVIVEVMLIRKNSLLWLNRVWYI
jgi:hypothetical protein